MLKMIKIESAGQVKKFHSFQAALYAEDANYIRPMEHDIEAVFDAAQNKLFLTGKCERFLCETENGTTVGKIAVFVNKKYKNKMATGGIGFFDSVNDQTTAHFMFDFAKEWLQKQGMEAMDGSINFGERDQFWGILTEGFQEPLYGMNYNFPYYKSLFESYGFQVYYEQLCYSRRIQDEIPKIFSWMQARHSKNPAISTRPLKIRHLKKFSADFTSIYNAAWASHGQGKQITPEKTLCMFQKMKPVLNEHISWFVYENEKPIAMWINIPDLNQWFKFLNGKMGMLQKIQFLWLKKFRKNTKMVGMVFGVVPEWQKTGIEGYMICEGTQHIMKHTHFKETEMQWIGDFNPKMLKIAKNLDTHVTRKLATYRYLFDREKKFEKAEAV